MDQVDTDNGQLIFSTEIAGTLTERMRIASGGTTQIGASSVANLSLGPNGSDIELSAKKDGTDAIDMVFKTQASGGALKEKMRISSEGTVKVMSNTDSELETLNIATAVNGTGGGNRQFDDGFTNASDNSFTGVDDGDQGYGYFPVTIVNGSKYTLFFK